MRLEWKRILCEATLTRVVNKLLLAAYLAVANFLFFVALFCASSSLSHRNSQILTAIV